MRRPPQGSMTPVLPEKKAIIFEADLESVEAEFNMPYISSIERRAEQRGIERGIEKGLERGIEKGLEKGIDQGRSKALSSLLEHRFGPLPSWAKEQLGKATSSLLDAWTPRVLDAPKLEDVFR